MRGLGKSWKRGSLINSRVTLELSSFYSRKLRDEMLARASMKYVLRISNVNIAEVDFNNLFEKAIQVSPRLQLKTLDTLQLVSAFLLRASVFITFDKDIVGKKEMVRNILGIEVQG